MLVTDWQCRVNANRGPWWQLFFRAPLLMRDKDLSQPATRVDTTCWQLFRPAINTVHFYFFVVAEVNMSTLLPEAPLWPEARGICDICYMVNPALQTGRQYIGLPSGGSTLGPLPPNLAVLLTHCGQMILGKISKKTDATRCQILWPKCTKFDFRSGSAPEPAAEAYNAPPDP